jgi:hypothetical protein
MPDSPDPTTRGSAAGPTPAELLDARHDDPDPTGPLTDYEPHESAATEGAAMTTAVAERARKDLMKRHAHEWEMETVSTAAHLIGEVVERTDRTYAAALREIDQAASAFDHDSVRQHVLDALQRALHA